MTPRIMSLCTGYMGLDLAVEEVLGATTVAVSDLDPGACRILEHRRPDVPNLGDLKLIDWQAWAGRVEIMSAGYPCQPFSHAGKRAGTDDPRHLFPYIVEGIRIVGPSLVVLENVRGHLALGFDTVLGALADIGYDARWVCLRASDVGAPHRRERLFIAATPRARRLTWQVPAPREFPAVEEPRGPRDSRRAGSDAADPSRERHGEGKDGRRVGRVDGTHEAGARQRQRSRALPAHRGPATPAHAHGDRGQGTEPQATRDGTQPALGRPRPEFGAYAPAVARWEAALGRPAPLPTDGRRLDPRFVEWMMGLPAGWVTDVPDLSRNAQLKALGNGVVPQQAAAALRFLLDDEEARVA